jgi:hypothetical protein
MTTKTYTEEQILVQDYLSAKARFDSIKKEYTELENMVKSFKSLLSADLENGTNKVITDGINTSVKVAVNATSKPTVNYQAVFNTMLDMLDLSAEQLAMIEKSKTRNSTIRPSNSTITVLKNKDSI